MGSRRAEIALATVITIRAINDPGVVALHQELVDSWKRSGPASVVRPAGYPQDPPAWCNSLFIQLRM
jgi:hypothetical protein